MPTRERGLRQEGLRDCSGSFLLTQERRSRRQPPAPCLGVSGRVTNGGRGAGRKAETGPPEGTWNSRVSGHLHANPMQIHVTPPPAPAPTGPAVTLAASPRGSAAADSFTRGDASPSWCLAAGHYSAGTWLAGPGPSSLSPSARATRDSERTPRDPAFLHLLGLVMHLWPCLEAPRLTRLPATLS